MDTGTEEAFRKETMEKIPASYSPMFHLLFPSIVGMGIATFGIFLVRSPTWLELLVVVFIWIVSNATEWRAHKHILHKRRKPLALLYDRHTPVHHRLFTNGDMSIRSRREFALVLIPPYAIVVIATAVAPIATLLFMVGQRNIAGLFLATTMLYAVSYEWLHLSYHLPSESFIGRLAWIRILKRHHATHHHPKLMQKWNFNVTIPFWDWVRGTVYRPLPAEPRSPTNPPNPASTC